MTVVYEMFCTLQTMKKGLWEFEANNEFNYAVCVLRSIDRITNLPDFQNKQPLYKLHTRVSMGK